VARGCRRWCGAAAVPLHSKTGEASRADTGIFQGSPSAPMLLRLYLTDSSTRCRARFHASEGYPLWTSLAGGRIGRVRIIGVRR